MNKQETKIALEVAIQLYKPKNGFTPGFEHDLIEFASRFLDKIRETQKPVAWLQNGEWPKHKHWYPSISELNLYGKPVPLFTTPPAPAIPEGWQLVPIDPTPEMINAAEIGKRMK
jgi:hypothetical protein